MLGDPLMSVRAALLTTTNTTGGDARSGVGGNEIQKMIDRFIIDDVNTAVDFIPRVARKPIPAGNLIFQWNLKYDLGSTSKAAFYTEGASGTPFGSRQIQLFAPAKGLRSDYAVSGLMQSAAFYDILGDEATDALREMQLVEEKACLCGTDTSAYGVASAYDGLLQLMGSNATFTDTDTIYGTPRATARDELDVSLVAAGATTQDALDLKDLDSAIQKSNDAGGKGAKRIWLCSTAREFEINQLLQPQGRFVIGAGSMEIEGGTKVSTYFAIPIVGSRFMDKNGITWNGSSKTKSYTDAAMYLLDMDVINFRVLNGVDKLHIPILGNSTAIRSDEIGGWFRTYGTFAMQKFRTSVLIYNLSVP